MKRVCGIYKITNLVNGKCIIGQSRNIHQRWGGHKWKLRNNKHENIHLQRSWNKYSEENFRLEIILECSIKKLNKEEIRLIKKYKTTDRKYGYNLDSGGWKDKQISEETRIKIGNASRGRIKSIETRLRISIGNKGKKRSAEARQHYSQKVVSKATRIKIGNIHRGKVLSDATKEKIRISHLGEKNKWFGKHHSKKHKLKMSRLLKGKKKSAETIQRMKEAWVLRKLNTNNHFPFRSFLSPKSM